MRKVLSRIGDYFAGTDKLLWILVVSATVYSSLLLSSVERAGGSFVRTQLMAAAIGLVLAAIISVIDYEYISRYWYILVIVSILLFGAVFLFGMTVAGTDDTAWIRLPGGLTFQPSELVKIFFIVTFATHLYYLKKKNILTNFLSIVTLLGHVAVPCVIIHFQGDDGSALVFLLIAFIMMFSAGVQWRYFIALGCMLAIGLPILWNVVMNDEHRNRILALMDIDGNALTDYGYQQYQSKVSIASGKLTGSGLWQGYRTGVGYVPEQENDFIFSVAGEELGFLGCVLIILILTVIIVRVFINGVKARDELGSFICYGMMGLLIAQTVINVGMVLGLLPVVGITLPFFSAGGTSTMCLYIGIGLVQSVRMHNKNVESVKVSYTRDERIKI
ncbi:MAG: FtsW/RodA/SpoVE family cell cycle protein [Eubacteriales bacterium]|nr:FtsW/RodA/SpoVE family cell cycle protein [Eubacteriales bacterium]